MVTLRDVLTRSRLRELALTRSSHNDMAAKEDFLKNILPRQGLPPSAEVERVADDNRNVYRMEVRWGTQLMAGGAVRLRSRPFRPRGRVCCERE